MSLLEIHALLQGKTITSVQVAGPFCRVMTDKMEQFYFIRFKEKWVLLDEVYEDPTPLFETIEHTCFRLEQEVYRAIRNIDGQDSISFTDPVPVKVYQMPGVLIFEVNGMGPKFALRTSRVKGSWEQRVVTHPNVLDYIGLAAQLGLLWKDFFRKDQPLEGTEKVPPELLI